MPIMPMKPVEKLWNTILSSYPLVVLDGNRKILKSMSGTIASYKEQLWLLTVCEGNPGSTILIYTGHSGQKGIYSPVSDIAAIEIEGVQSPEGVRLYFAVGKLENQIPCHYQEMDAKGNILAQKDRRVLPISPHHQPNLADRYSFAFLANRSSDPDRFDHSVHPVEELEFSGKTDSFFRFQTTRRSGAFEYHPGCEGAPILNEEGDLVSLLVGVQASKGRAAGPHSGAFLFGLDFWRYIK